MSVAAIQKVFLTPTQLVLFDVPWVRGSKERAEAWDRRFGSERTLVRTVNCFACRVEAERADVREYPTAALLAEDGHVTRKFSSQSTKELLRWAEEAFGDLKQYTTRE